MERNTQTAVTLGIVLLVIAGLVGLAWSMGRDNDERETSNIENVVSNNSAENDVSNETTQNNTTLTVPEARDDEPEEIPKEPAGLAEPIAEFEARVTKKRFGTYVTPANSPVQPERFSGYHNALDVEYGDVSTDVPVYAVADGEITASRTADGYGGVFTMKFSHEGKEYTALYGHIRPSTLPKVGAAFKKGDRVGILGTGFTSETDGERKHLHFAVKPGTSVDIRGYVTSESQLSGWIDPLSLY